jgi:hypothetical protein
MDNFSQILRWFPKTMEEPSMNNHFIGVTPFKIHINFDIPLFEYQIEVDTLKKWSSMLKGYFSIQKFSNSEKVSFALLKALPHFRFWWHMYYEKHSRDESIIFWARTHLGSIF